MTSRSAQNCQILKTSSDSAVLRTGETTVAKASVEVVVSEEDVVVLVIEEEEEEGTTVAGEAATEVEEEDTITEILTGEVAEEATIMAMEEDEEEVLEVDGEVITEMTMTGMMAPTGAEGVIETEVTEVPTSQEATEAAEVTTDILHEGYL